MHFLGKADKNQRLNIKLEDLKTMAKTLYQKVLEFAVQEWPNTKLLLTPA